MWVIEASMEEHRNARAGENGISPRKPVDQRHLRFPHASIRTPADKVKKRGSDKGDTNTHTLCLIAPTRKMCSVSMWRSPAFYSILHRDLHLGSKAAGERTGHHVSTAYGRELSTKKERPRVSLIVLSYSNLHPQNRNRKTFRSACAVQDCTGQNLRVWANNEYSVSSPSAFDEDTTIKCEFLEDCIRIYECEPCLWQVKCKEYHGMVKKDAVYAQLLVILKEVRIKATKGATDIQDGGRHQHHLADDMKPIWRLTDMVCGGKDVFRPNLEAAPAQFRPQGLACTCGIGAGVREAAILLHHPTTIFDVIDLSLPTHVTFDLNLDPEDL
ncbi:hypothetical protein PR048_008160 [Dryococelus australis]|uniref:Uncharacterized protein n=1 Tax=Dryococelus australis TaxID=614101 RepID=A0ABQ9HXY9_9NEOP|nr:hypothetical protein PR048_008160 [Dryococelus australis]